MAHLAPPPSTAPEQQGRIPHMHRWLLRASASPPQASCLQTRQKSGRCERGGAAKRDGGLKAPWARKVSETACGSGMRLCRRGRSLSFQGRSARRIHPLPAQLAITGSEQLPRGISAFVRVKASQSDRVRQHKRVQGVEGRVASKQHAHVRLFGGTHTRCGDERMRRPGQGQRLRKQNVMPLSSGAISCLPLTQSVQRMPGLAYSRKPGAQ